MTNTIFCLSVPGGHMTYIGLLIKFLLGHLDVDKKYITKTGSAHNAEQYFPPHLNHVTNTAEWDLSIAAAIKNYAHNEVCVIKDGWDTQFKLSYWEEKLNSLPNVVSVISTPASKLDWYYCWVSFSYKMPVGVYSKLKIQNSLFPIWHMLNNKHRLNVLGRSMPIFPLKEDMYLKSPHCRFPTTNILKEDFPSILHSFLTQQGFKSNLTLEIIEFHKYFVVIQQNNLNLAVKLSNNERWEPRNMIDKILFRWMDTNPWEGLE